MRLTTKRWRRIFRLRFMLGDRQDGGTHPPTAGQAFLEVTLSTEGDQGSESYAEDMAEIYRSSYANDSRLTAAGRYWTNVIKSVAGYVIVHVLYLALGHELGDVMFANLSSWWHKLISWRIVD